MATETTDRLRFWQALLAAEVSPSKSRGLLRDLGSSLDVTRLRNHPSLTEQERKRVDAIPWLNVQDLWADGARLLLEEDYPEALGEAGEQPPALYVFGEDRVLYAPCIAIVGTRSASTYGKACAQKFAEAFARAGATVISGGALGIDAAAHKGALAGGGSTAAVLAGGVDTVYPAVHAGLFRDIRAHGCLVSQFALGSKVADYKFLQRNHLIAALSLAVLVVESPARSGALSTAHVANELGRQVFVVPAGIDHSGFHGSHGLIRDGATLVTHPDQVLEELGIAPGVEVPLVDPGGDSGAAIVKILTTTAISVEKIVELTGLSASEVLTELTLLELDGRIFRDTGGYALKI